MENPISDIRPEHRDLLEKMKNVLINPIVNNINDVADKLKNDGINPGYIDTYAKELREISRKLEEAAAAMKTVERAD